MNKLFLSFLSLGVLCGSLSAQVVGKNISQFPAASALTGGELVPIWQGGATKKLLLGNAATKNIGVNPGDVAAGDDLRMDISKAAPLFVCANTYEGVGALNISVSSDLVHWSDVNKRNNGLVYGDPALTTPGSDKARDPSLIKVGKLWYAINTDGVLGAAFGPTYSKYVHISSSPDLINWTAVANVQCRNDNAPTWGPTWFKDDDGTLYFVVGLQNISANALQSFLFRCSDSAPASTSTWTNLGQINSSVRLVNDMQLVKANGAYYMVYVGDGNGSTAGGHPLNFFLSKATTLTGTWTQIRTGNWVNLPERYYPLESPSLRQLPDGRWVMTFYPQYFGGATGLCPAIISSGANQTNIETCTFTQLGDCVTDGGPNFSSMQGEFYVLDTADKVRDAMAAFQSNGPSIFQSGPGRYQLPSASTTLAGLTTNQTFSGNNTFSGNTTFTGTVTMAGQTELKGQFNAGGPSAGYVFSGTSYTLDFPLAGFYQDDTQIDLEVTVSVRQPVPFNFLVLRYLVSSTNGNRGGANSTNLVETSSANGSANPGFSVTVTYPDNNTLRLTSVCTAPQAGRMFAFVSGKRFWTP